MSLQTHFHANRTTLSWRIQIWHKSGFYYHYLLFFSSVNIKRPRHQFGLSLCLGLAISLLYMLYSYSKFMWQSWHQLFVKFATCFLLGSYSYKLNNTVIKVHRWLTVYIPTFLDIIYLVFVCFISSLFCAHAVNYSFTFLS